MERVLDACCGSRMFWLDKQNDDVLYVDKRDFTDTLSDGRTLEVKPNGTLIFKWNEDQIKWGEILKAFEAKPLFGNRRSKTHWLTFMERLNQQYDLTM